MFPRGAYSAVAASLLLASLALSVSAVSQVNPYVAPSISLSPTSGGTGTAVTVTGTGFSAGVTVTLSSGTLVFSGASSATAGGSGGFTAQITIVSGSSGANTVTAGGSDLATNPADHASATFTISNVQAVQQTTVSVTSGSASVDDSATTGVKVAVSGLTGVTNVGVSTSSLNTVSASVTPLPIKGAVYVDVHVTVPAGTKIPAGATANICVSNSGVSSNWSLEYWAGSGWGTATGVTVTGTTVCGNIPVADLTGTNVAAVPAAAAPDYTYLYLGVFVVVLVIIIAAGLLLRRGSREA